MIKLAVCLWFSTAALAQHYGAPAATSNVPMDFNDDIYNRDMRVLPSSSFTYNFEHARRDQPSHVETREENIGQYMGRPRPSTVAPVMPDISKQEVPQLETVHLHHLSDVKPTYKPYAGPQQWDPISSHLPATMPAAPTTPKWMDLSDDSFQHHSHYQPSRQRENTYEPINTYAPIPTYAPVAQRHQPSYAYVNEERAQQPQETYPVMQQYAPPSTERTMPVEHYPRESAQQRQGSSGRGNHKFSLSDVQMPAQAAPVPAPAAPAVPAAKAPGQGPPPPVPTLSPWADGFGK